MFYFVEPNVSSCNASKYCFLDCSFCSIPEDLGKVNTSFDPWEFMSFDLHELKDIVVIDIKMEDTSTVAERAPTPKYFI